MAAKSGADRIAVIYLRIDAVERLGRPMRPMGAERCLNSAGERLLFETIIWHTVRGLDRAVEGIFE
jgi:hypothetical protein